MSIQHSTQFEPSGPLTEEEVEQEVHWLTYSMALRSFERKVAKTERQGRPARAPWIELWAHKLGG